jgi:hypothetical protein
VGSIRQTSSEVVLARFGRVWQGLAGSGKRELRKQWLDLGVEVQVVVFDWDMHFL